MPDDPRHRHTKDAAQQHEEVLSAALARDGGLPPPSPRDEIVTELHRALDHAVGLTRSARSVVRLAGNTLPPPVTAIGNRLWRSVADTLVPATRPAGTAGPAPEVLEFGALSPGDGRTRELIAHNQADEPARGVRLTCSGLLAEGGRRIPGSAVRVEPDLVAIGPGELVRLAVRLDVPPNAGPGRYTGVLASAHSSAVRVLLHVEVR
jgi:hypothetical protein